jgi:hypothetical protein
VGSTAAEDRDGDVLYRRPAPPPGPDQAEPGPAVGEPAVPAPANWPSIADYWPDAPHRIAPPADYYTAAEPQARAGAAADPAWAGPRTAATPPRAGVGTAADLPAAPPSFARPTAEMPLTTTRPGRTRALVTVGAAVLLAGGIAAGGVAYLRDRDRPAGTVGAAPSAAGPAAPPATEPVPVPVAPKPSTSAPAAPLPESAAFELVSDATVVNLGTARLGDELYRVSAPTGSSVRPVAEIEGDRVRLSLVTTKVKGTAAVDITLNAAVRWDLMVSGGVRTGVLDLRDTRLGGVDLRGGATRLDLRLPRPDGTLRVRMAGGVNSFRIHTLDRVPARVLARRGAGKVTLYDLVEDGVARGQLLASPAFDRSTDRIDVDAVAGMGTLVVADR